MNQTPNERIFLSPPHMGGKEQHYVQQAFESNFIAPVGENISGFEADISQYLNYRRKAVTLNSGTAAIHLALILAGVKAGDEVICQSFTFCGSCNPIAYLGAKPVFVDSERDTWNLSPLFLEEAIQDRLRNGKKPAAVIAIHLYGMPYMVDEINAIAKKYEIPIIEDSAEAIGAWYDQKPCGTLGDYGIFSFNGNKLITTGGGGALLVKTKALYDRALYLATQARQPAAYYEHTEIGYNYRMSNVSAGIGRGQMEVLESHLKARKEVNNFYRKLFRNILGVTVQGEPDAKFKSNFWLTTILVDPSEAPFTNKILLDAFAEANIESRPLWKPMHLQPIYQNAPYYGDQVCEDLYNSGLCLPSGSAMGSKEFDRIEKVIKKLIG
ncbi:MAG: DegT/DnrJ/EryC1/StrS family aminotransferase [Leeuwenhoekiella sp.]